MHGDIAFLEDIELYGYVSLLGEAFCCYIHDIVAVFHAFLGDFVAVMQHLFRAVAIGEVDVEVGGGEGMVRSSDGVSLIDRDKADDFLSAGSENAREGGEQNCRCGYGYKVTFGFHCFFFNLGFFFLLIKYSLGLIFLKDLGRKDFALSD